MKLYIAYGSNLHKQQMESAVLMQFHTLLER